MILLLYRIIAWIATPFFLLRAAFTGKSSEQKRARFGEFSAHADLWLHAASVGEISLLEPLVELLLEKNASLKIHVTAMTEPGVRRAEELFGSRCTVSSAPYDLPVAVEATFATLQPNMVAFAETEIWPNLILGCARHAIPTILINGRMSERGIGGYRLVRGTASRVLSSHERLFVRSEADETRFRSFSIPQERIVLAGDMKFDAPVQSLTAEERKRKRRQLGISDSEFLFVAGSTRPGEEEIILSAFAEAASNDHSLRLIIAPRHLQRLDEVRQIVCASGRTVVDIDDATIQAGIQADIESTANVLLVTQMGLLKGLYQCADLSFVGGTLVPIGGHNILEPVWAGCPVLYGPHTSNVVDADEYLRAHQFGAKIADQDELVREITLTRKNPTRFARKSSVPLADSATLLIAEYILSRLR